MNYLKDDDIVALSTVLGISAIAVIRLSGKNSFSIVSKIFKSHSKNNKKQIQHGYIVYQNKIKDDVLCTFFKAPYTYTGENLVEISVHGNPLIIKSILNILCINGARLAEPGEFTYRAFLNGKMDLLEAESVCSLIRSQTNISTSLSLNNLTKVFSNKIKNILKIIVNLLTYIEANLNYPEDNIRVLSQKEKSDKIDYCVKIIKELLNSYNTTLFCKQSCKAIIIGKPNSGKSSIFNAIIGKDKAIVTDISGTTTDIIEENIEYKGYLLTFIDTAGINNTSKNFIECLGQKKTVETLKKANLIIWVCDISLKLDKNDKSIAQYINLYRKQNIPIIVLLNKSDLTHILSVEKIRNVYSNIKNVMIISVKKGFDINELLNNIVNIIGNTAINLSTNVMVNERQHKLLEDVLKFLVAIKKVINLDEIICFYLVNIQEKLNEILGIKIKQNILENIFSKFCIGK
jgi:tRNA modification GTPase